MSGRIHATLAAIFLLLGLMACGGLTHRLPPEVLERIDNVTAVMERGIEVGPETRAAFEELNQTVRNKTLFTDKELARIDQLLAIVEAGIQVQVGVPPEVQAEIDRALDILERYPQD